MSKSLVLVAALLCATGGTSMAQDTATSAQSATGAQSSAAAKEFVEQAGTSGLAEVEMGELGVWTRLHYVYPYPHVDEVFGLMNENKILPYIDIPFQHASPAVLKNMRRPAHQEKTLERVLSWRRQVPDLTVRSTFIVGFPGETDAEFEELLDFLRAAELDRVGAFAYSPVDGAKANELPDPVSEELKEDRLEQFMAVQAEISAAKLRRKIGRTIKVLVDEAGADGAVARSAADAPEIDGSVLIADGQSLKPGQFVEVVVESASEHDLIARLAHPGLKVI